MPRSGRIASRLGAVALTLCVVLSGTSALAVPKVGQFGRGIDPISGYEGATKCDPDPEPGVVAFQQMVMRAYPSTGAGSISRACSGGTATSEHNEGRAWDWGVNAGVPSQKEIANELIDWLIKDDRYGNEHAMARRAGVMYLIWNRRIWFPWSGWEVYCEQKKRGCVDPDDGGVRHPHTDHVHFSFSREGAKKKTTLYNRNRSYISAIEAEKTSTGYWLIGRNGSVFGKSAEYYGSKEDRYTKTAYISIAATPASDGYWMLNQNGNVVAMGDARARGDIADNPARAVDIESTPTGNGYWIAAKNGRVFSFGNAGEFGNALDRDVEIIGMAATTSGRGYWLLASNGKVFAFGDAPELGELDADSGAADIVATPTGGGYWVVTEEGRVRAFGDAQHHGDAADESLSSAIVGIAPTPTGQGYRLVSEMGTVLDFGDAS